MGETSDRVWTGSHTDRSHTDNREIDKQADSANANPLHFFAEKRLACLSSVLTRPRYLTSYHLIYDSPANISSLPRG